MRRVSVFILFLYLGAGAAAAALAKEKPWYRYENSFFEVYSDASEKKVRRLLLELENFRAATVQIMTVKIPRGAPKTQVLIFSSGNDFQKVANDDLVDGFAVGINGVPYVVMSAGGRKSIANMAIRHEYTHILMGYKGQRYPVWYEEGIAEFMSGTEFRSKGTRFTVGQRTPRVLQRGSLVPWDELISDDFELHSIRDAGARSNAYMESWLLVHYLTLGEDLRYASELDRYLDLYARGESSTVAFETAFGMSAGEMGNRLAKTYNGPVPIRVIPFEPEVQDHDFARSEANSGDVQEILEALTRKFRDAFR